MSTGSKKLFCFGYGYTCDYLGHELLEHDSWQVSGTTRNSDKKNDLIGRGIKAHLFDYERQLPDPLKALEETTHLLISTPPDGRGDPVFLLHGQDILQIPTIEWVGYLSTTGVYGDRGGGWVDETSEIRPTTKRGSRREKAEKQWGSLLRSSNLPVHIFRLSGIYGPGRSALDSVRAGVARRIKKEGHAFGRVHVEDIVQVLLASMNSPHPGEIYNICDDVPASSHEIIEYACELLKRPPPPLVNFDDADLAPITRSFYLDNRRIRNNKIKTDLGVQLKYKSFEDGLQACMSAEDHAVSLFKAMLNSSS